MAGKFARFWAFCAVTTSQTAETRRLFCAKIVFLNALPLLWDKKRSDFSCRANVVNDLKFKAFII